MSGVFCLRLLARQVAIGAYKNGLLGFGGFITLPLVFGLTHGVGRVMDVYLGHKARGEVIKPETFKKMWKDTKKEGQIKFRSENIIQSAIMLRNFELRNLTLKFTIS